MIAKTSESLESSVGCAKYENVKPCGAGASCVHGFSVIRRLSAVSYLVASFRRYYAQPQGACRSRHAAIVRHNGPQVGAQFACSRKVDGVERSQCRGHEDTRSIEHTVADTNEIDAGEHSPASFKSLLPKREQCPSHLGAHERAGNKWAAAAEVAPQRS